MAEDKTTKEKMEQNKETAIQGQLNNIMQQLSNLDKIIAGRFENMKKVVGDYLELSSSISISTVKAALKNV